MEEFLSACEEARKLAFSFNEPLIVHHYDADGLSSGSIVAAAFQEQGKASRRECIKKLDDKAIDKLSKEKELIFVDLGGGNKRVDELQDVLIIDHHQTEGIGKTQINPLLYGIDGSDELSAAGTAYCVFRTHPELGVVGSIGDMQMPLKGMNRWVLEQGVESGDIVIENDLRFYGRHCRDLIQFLAFSDYPFIPGISYRQDKAEELLTELKIPLEDGGKRRMYAELNEEEKRQLISALAKILVNANQLRKAEELIGENYVFPKRPRNETYEANEFSTLLNACGRHARPDLGVRVCLGDESAYPEAREMLQTHRRMIRKGIDYASSHRQDLGKFRFIDGRGRIDESIIGIVCGMSMHPSFKRPVIGIADGDDDTIKVSGRASRSAVADGMDLGELMRKAAGEVGGIGGGHRPAAGASIPGDKLNEFLLAAGKVVEGHVVKTA
jgi:RecJ-like exonuclease